MKISANFFIFLAVISLIAGVTVKFLGAYTGFYVGLRPQTFMIFCNTCLLFALVFLSKSNKGRQ